MDVGDGIRLPEGRAFGRAPSTTPARVFGTFAGFGAVDPDIAYVKLAALAEGAAIASARN